MAMGMANVATPLEAGWAMIEAGLRRGEHLSLDGSQLSMDEHAALYEMAYRLTTQKPPDNFSDDLYQRFKSDVDEVSARAAARLADKQGGEYAVALDGAWKSFNLYIKLANFIFKYLDRFYIYRMNLPEIKIVAHHSFGNALSAQAALSGSAGDRRRDIALLAVRLGSKVMVPGAQLRTVGQQPMVDGQVVSSWRCANVQRTKPHERPPSFEAKWHFCVAAQRDAPAQALARRNALALMLALCAKDPPRAELADNHGALSVAVRLAAAGKKDMVELILKQVAEEGGREIRRSVDRLLDPHCNETEERWMREQERLLKLREEVDASGASTRVIDDDEELLRALGYY